MKRHVLLFLTVLTLLSSSCVGQPTPVTRAAPPEEVVIVRNQTGAAVLRGPAAGPVQPPTTGLQFRLGEGQEQPQAAQAIPTAEAQPLSDARAQAILARLPALPTAEGDVQAFALPAESLPPPRPGNTIQEPFPPAATPAPPEQAAGPLAVLRYAPEGDVPLAPYLSVTFNQPMVALTGLADLAAQEVPVKISPEPPGQWRWVGTKTLLFQPDLRFPMATVYTAEVPAGTASASGSKLAEGVTWTFTTPPPQVQATYPTGPSQPLELLMFVSFDQAIDPEAVLASITVLAGEKRAAIRLATEAEVKAGEAVSRLAGDATAGRWLSFMAEEPFPADTEVVVSVGPGTPSAEGPRKTETAQTYSFHTFGPLKVTDSNCAWGPDCPPFTPWNISFSNALDEAYVLPADVQITPSLPGAKVNVYGNTLLIQGNSRARTRYDVKLSAGIRDVYGQKLGADTIVTFRVGAAQPTFWAPGDTFVVLDPAARPSYSVFTVNYRRLKVHAYAVTPDDWAEFKSYLTSYYQDQKPIPPGKLVLDKTINVEFKADELIETSIDLSPALKDGLGHLVLIVEPEVTGLAALLPSWNQRPIAPLWVESTRIGLDAFVDGDQMVAWANALTDGAPLNGVALSLVPGDRSATTDDAGVARMPLPDGKPAALLVARQGADVAMLPAYAYAWGEMGWQRQPRADALRWYVFDDRGIYRPGEQVHVKGWIRRIGAGPAGDVGGLEGAVETLSYRLMDPQGNQVATGQAELNALGGFDFELALAENMNLGTAMLEMNASGGKGGVDGTQFTHPLQVQEFRRPEFEVKTEASEGPHFVRGDATVSVSANYYAGGSLPNAEVTWQVTTAPGQYSPPGWDDFTFGRWIPWWRYDNFGYPVVERGETYTGRTDAMGVHRLRLDFLSVDPPEPSTVTAQATVMDVNRQAWTASSTLLVHPSALYVGLRTDRYFVKLDEPLRVDAIVTDLDGAAVAGREITMRAARLEWKYQNGSWQEVEAGVQPCRVISGKTPVRCTFETPEGGTYRITATVKDDQGRLNQTEITRWVSGGSQPPSREVKQEEVMLIPDRKEYRPGDTAEILVQAPFYPAEGVLTLRRSGLLSTQRFTMEGSTYTLQIAVEAAHIPNLYVQVDLVGAAGRVDDNGQVNPDLPKRPAFATGHLDLAVPPFERALTVEVTPRDLKLEPGGKTTVDLLVKDAAGKPVEGAEAAVVVADEAVLALVGYQMADPLAVFYTERSPDVSDHHLRADVLLAAVPDLTAGIGMGGGGGGPMAAAAPSATAAPAMEMASDMSKGARGEAPAIATRIDFNPLALFAPAVPTDANGRASVEVKLPDNLTRYRVMAVAVSGGKVEDPLAGKQFGKGESVITARLPLMVRPSPPRFLNFGDSFELPIVLQNGTDVTMTVAVAVRAANATLTAGAGREVVVPANDRVEVRFPVTTDRAGSARFQVAAVAAGPTGGSGKAAASDAAQFELPVWTPATTEAFAVYGEVDQGAIAQPVIAPTGVFTQFGGLEITTSSTALQALTDAVLYLVKYPFECSEQIASRVLGVASLRDVLTAFQAEGLPAAKEIDAAVEGDIKRLQAMQNDDGGFPVWRRGDESLPFYSIHAANALQRAKQKGYTVPDETLAQAKTFLQSIEQHIPSWYGQSARDSLIAYALNVRKQMGDADTARARRLVQETGLEKLSPEAIGWLLAVLTDDPNSKEEVSAIRRHLQNRVTETAGTAHFVSDYGDDAYLILYSDRRADGVLLDALIQDQPESDLITKVVRGLMAQRKAGHWGNTQEDVFILMALDRYFNTYEAETPEFVARMWLGDQYAGEVGFKGRSTDYHEVQVPMSYLAGLSGSQSLIVSKEGTGRLYYRLGLRYAPVDLKLPPADYGFTVERTYEAVDNPGDVRRDADGTWHVKAGARVRVRLTMVAPARRYHVALVDPLPAGLEPLNPALAVTGTLPWNAERRSSPYGWWWGGPWYEHENLRDERVEAFTSLLWEGVYTYSYIARATTPGRFVVPPAKAEEMYAPETFGRSGAEIVVVQ